MARAAIDAALVYSKRLGIEHEVCVPNNSIVRSRYIVEQTIKPDTSSPTYLVSYIQALHCIIQRLVTYRLTGEWYNIEHQCTATFRWKSIWHRSSDDQIANLIRSKLVIIDVTASDMQLLWNRTCVEQPFTSAIRDSIYADGKDKALHVMYGSHNVATNNEYLIRLRQSAELIDKGPSIETVFGCRAQLQEASIAHTMQTITADAAHVAFALLYGKLLSKDNGQVFAEKHDSAIICDVKDLGGLIVAANEAFNTVGVRCWKLKVYDKGEKIHEQRIEQSIHGDLASDEDLAFACDGGIACDY